MPRTALYRHFDAEGRLLYVGISECLGERDRQHAATAHWHGDVARTETQWCLSREHALALERVAIQFEAPAHNVALARAETAIAAVKVEALPAKGAERLTAFLAETKTKRAALAEKLGVAKSHVTELCQGRKKPGRELAFKIEGVTGGLIPASSWSEAA